MEDYIVAQGVDVLRVNEKAIHVKETGSDLGETASSGFSLGVQESRFSKVAHNRSAHTRSFLLPLLNWLERWMIVGWSRGFESVSSRTDDGVDFTSLHAPEGLQFYCNQQALRSLGVRPATFFIMAMANEIGSMMSYLNDLWTEISWRCALASGSLRIDLYFLW